MENTALVILGAGRPHHGDVHVALQSAFGQSRVLDWVIHATSAIGGRTHFVAGYESAAIRQRYPEFTYWINDEWQATKAGHSLLCVDLDEIDECVVAYADALFREAMITSMVAENADVVVAVDSHWRVRFSGRTAEDMERCEKACLAGRRIIRLGADLLPDTAHAEFVGCVRFSRIALAHLRRLQHETHSRLRTANLSDVVEELRLLGLEVVAIDVCGDWAELREPRDLARFVLGTKAQTLQRLRSMVSRCRIEDQVCFTVASWRSQRTRVLEDVRSRFGGDALVVRSSALSEDGFTHSNAGAYTSLLNVDGSKSDQLSAAIEKVVASFGGHDQDEVLVQPMLSDVRASGVVFTRTLSNGAPYYVANYDDVTGSTETITNGSSREHKTLVIRRDADPEIGPFPQMLRRLVPALREIESLLGYDSVDVEFAVTGEDELHVLQVRPIAVHHAGWGGQDGAIIQIVDEARAEFRRLQKPTLSVVGRRTLFGVMPDWNPAEIIGPKPGQLAFSLYRYLIMDDVWAVQRAEYGYRDVRPQPLMAAFAGHPYVDVRASFNSFLPAALDDHLAARLVDFYVDWLEAHPHLHDKVEFEVVPTCFGLDFDRWESRLCNEGGFAIDEVNTLAQALRQITRTAIARGDRDLDKVRELELRYDRLRELDLDPLSKAWVTLEDCRRFGTLPFAHLARSAFVAMALLKSAVAKGVLKSAEVDDFLASIRTVSHALTTDARATATGRMEWASFVERYGHLRPGTYDIASPSYRADPEHYLRPIVDSASVAAADHDEGRVGVLWPSARRRLTEALRQIDIVVEDDQLDTFLRASIEGREYAKFVFTRNLSLALDQLADWGANFDVAVNDLAHANLNDLLAFRGGSLAGADVSKLLAKRIEEGRSLAELARSVELPPLITSDHDFLVFQYPDTQANFVGSGKVCAPCSAVSGLSAMDDLAGRIALIPQADPGYDWLFGRRIGGLITMFGGANSHMAIRAAEFGIPAAIGVGQTWYEKLATAQVIDLDAGTRTIRVVR